MVVFTCAHCGESLHKPKVEKHYETKCYNKYPDICCVDCLKDFRGDEYKSHTSCMTEAHRYGGKGFVPKENKGEKKQSAWVEIVQSVLEENQSLSGSLRGLLERVSKQPNTPRKQAKFFNFVTSMNPRTNPKDIEKAWSLLSAKLELIKGNAQNNGRVQNGNKNSNNGPQSIESENANGDEINDSQNVSNNDGSSKKKLKKDATGDESLNNKSISNGDNYDQNEMTKKEKKEKKKREKSEIQNMEESDVTIKKKEKDLTNKTEKSENNVSNGNEVILNNVDKPLTKKERKEKKKREKYEAQVEEIKNENNEINPDKEEMKSRKRKLKEESEVTKKNDKEDESIEVNTNKIEPLAKKLKTEDAEAFDWVNAISSILSSKNKQISLKKLEKKVFTEFCATTNVETVTDRLNKKFMKALKKIDNILIENEKVSIVSSD